MELLNALAKFDDMPRPGPRGAPRSLRGHGAAAQSGHAARLPRAVAGARPCRGAARGPAVPARRSGRAGARRGDARGAGQRQAARHDRGRGRTRRARTIEARGAGRAERGAFLEGQAVRKVIVVPGKIVNIVAGRLNAGLPIPANLVQTDAMKPIRLPSSSCAATLLLGGLRVPPAQGRQPAAATSARCGWCPAIRYSPLAEALSQALARSAPCLRRICGRAAASGRCRSASRRWPMPRTAATAVRRDAQHPQGRWGSLPLAIDPRPRAGTHLALRGGVRPAARRWQRAGAAPGGGAARDYIDRAHAEHRHRQRAGNPATKCAATWSARSCAASMLRCRRPAGDGTPPRRPACAGVASRACVRRPERPAMELEPDALACAPRRRSRCARPT